MYKNISTPNHPLYFFEVFLSKDNFDAFANDFFTNYDNPTFYADLKNGFIEYIDNVYQADEPIEPRVIYFKSYLINIIKPQISNSINLIKNKTEEIVINGSNPHNYINILRKKYQVIRKEIIKNNSYKDFILPEFEKIESVIKLSGFEKLPYLKAQKGNGNYFKPRINESKLKKIYKIARRHEIIDVTIVSEVQFLNIFNCSNPVSVLDKFIFYSDNRKGLFFLNCMAIYFENLKPSSIAQSKLFSSKKKTPLSQNSIDRINSHFRKNKINYPEILESFVRLEK
jgi:hypothetical protein